MRLTISTFLLAVVLVWPTGNTFAQNFRIRLTLTTDSIQDIHQDSLGMVWLACTSGLYSYNGRNHSRHATGAFKSIYPISPTEFISVSQSQVFRVKGSQTFGLDITINELKSISSAAIKNIVGYKSKLFIHTQDGLFLLNGEQLQQLNVPNFGVNNSILVKEEEALKLITPRAIYQWNVDQNSFIQTQSFPTNLENIIHYATGRKSKGESLIVTLKAVYSHTDTGELKKVVWRGLPDHFVISSIQYYEDRIILGSLKDGLWMGKPSTLGGYAFSAVMDGSDAHRTLFFPYKSISKILLTDHDINLWVLHEKGLSLLQESLFTKVSQLVPLAAFDQATFLDDGTVYMESDNGIFVLKKNDVGDYVSTRSTRDVFAYSPAIGGKGDRVWFGSRDYSLMYLQNNQQKEIIDLSDRGQSIYHLYPDRDNNVWVFQAPGANPITGLLKVTYNNKVIDYNESKGFESRMLSIKEDKDGNLFAAGIGEHTYLYKYDKQTDRFVNISVPMNFDFGESFEVHDLAIDHDGIIWLCSTTGLLKYKDGKIEKILIEELYGSEVVSGVVDKENNLWIGTNLNGVFRINKQGYSIFDQYAGLAINTMSYRSIYAREDGSIWAASEEGFFVSSPEINNVRETKRPLLLSINKKPVTTTTTTTTVYPFRSSLSFDFLSLTFPVSTVEYSYSLAGYNNNRWTKLSQYDSLVLTNLAEGRYELQIRARQRGGYEWSIPVVYSFTIEEVWYLQPAFILLYMFVFIICTAIGVIYYNNRLIREKRVLEEKVAQRTVEITKKNDEILEQNEELKHLSEEIASQRDSIEKQNNLLEQAKRDLELKVQERTTELSKANTELTDQNIQLEQYAFMTAHNLRAPIARLIGLTHIFNENDLTDLINRDVIKRVKYSVHELDEVVHDINTILQVKKGINATLTELNLVDTINKVLINYREELNQRHIKVSFCMEPNLNITGIEAYVYSVIQNVISNSIKYSSRHKAATIKIEIVDGNQKDVMVVLSDNGIGFDFKSQPQKLFKPFSRFHAEGEGKGLGLYMIKIQMESMQGSVDIKSAVGKGTTVTLTFRKASAVSNA